MIRRPRLPLLRDTRAANAVEFAIVALPFLYVLLVILQMGLYYMTQAALDNGVLATANNLRNSFNTGTAPVLPTGSSLKSSIVGAGGGLLGNNGMLAVDLRALTTLDAGGVAIADGTVDAVSTNVPIVLRAKANVTAFAPGFGASTQVLSSVVLRFNAF
jgi:Flp pilus assembly protein TadG